MDKSPLGNKPNPQLRILIFLATDHIDAITSGKIEKEHYHYYHTQIKQAKNGPRN